MTLFYMPLEGYQERYTHQWSAPETGWLERNWRRAGLDYKRVEGNSRGTRTIKTGSVVDAVGRSTYCFAQVAEVLRLAEAGELGGGDTIYFDDFWHPGIEALPYAFHLMGIDPKIYAFLHAQSVDEFDFTYPMRRWMRHFEKGIAEALDGIFVCGNTLADLVAFGGISPRAKIHVTGHPFSGDEVMSRMPEWYQNGATRRRKDQVVWSSRWDAEKNPEFFLEVARKVIRTSPTATFVVCTSAPELRSNDPDLIIALRDHVRIYDGRIVLKEGLTKEEYYAELCGSKVQFNCADQDFVAITLLEASVAGCYPVYPYFRSFPETFLNRTGFMYERGNLDQAAKMVLDALARDDLWSPEQIESRSWIYRRFDYSWIRMLSAMRLTHGLKVSAQEYELAAKDPYSTTL